MAIFAIGDLHLATGCDKPMDVFAGWENYVARITQSWREQVSDGDTVVLAGDTSWGMTLQEAGADFALLDALPGRKVILKGNHDYWWSSRSKMEGFFAQNQFATLYILHNNVICAEGVGLCGTRGWMLEEGTEHDQKIAAREEGRLRASLEAARAEGLEPVVFLHYPPLYGESVSGRMIELMLQYGVRRCFYGHLHAGARRFAFEGRYLGVEFALISADHLQFKLRQV